MNANAMASAVRKVFEQAAYTSYAPPDPTTLPPSGSSTAHPEAPAAPIPAVPGRASGEVDPHPPTPTLPDPPARSIRAESSESSTQGGRTPYSSDNDDQQTDVSSVGVDHGSRDEQDFILQAGGGGGGGGQQAEGGLLPGGMSEPHLRDTFAIGSQFWDDTGAIPTYPVLVPDDEFMVPRPPPAPAPAAAAVAAAAAATEQVPAATVGIAAQPPVIIKPPGTEVSWAKRVQGLFGTGFAFVAVVMWWFAHLPSRTRRSVDALFFRTG